MAETDHQATESSSRSNVPEKASDCPLCQKKAEVYWRLPHVWHQRVGSRPYDILWCENCDLGFLNPRPGLEEHVRLSRESRERYESMPALIPKNPSIPERIRVRLAWRVSYAQNRQINAGRIHELLGGVPSLIGVCGADDQAISELKGLGHRVATIAPGEFAGELADDGTSRTGPAAGDDVARNSANEPLDVVWLSQRLQLCVDLVGAIESARHRLKPGGYFLAEVPNHQSYSAVRLGPAWYFCDPGRALNFLTGRSLSKLMRITGFEVCDLLYSNYTVQFRRPRLEIEQEIWDRLYGTCGATESRPPVRNSAWELWRRLLFSMFRDNPGKYEIVAVIASKNHEGSRPPERP